MTLILSDRATKESKQLTILLPLGNYNYSLLVLYKIIKQ